MIIKAEELKIVYEKEVDGRIRPVYFIDAEPVRKARWENRPHKMMGEAPCCTMCGKFVPIETKYCPNCGAKMDGGRKEK